MTFEGDSQLTSIEEDAFSGCSSLTSITIPASVTSIGDWAFYNCSSLQSVTFAGDSKLTSIGESAFSGCSSLNAVYINDLEAWCGIDFGGTTANPLSYAHHLYVDEQEVIDLRIPDGVTSIGKWAFYDCTSLTSITIPEGVTSIGRSAFDDCSSLQNVTFEGDSKLTSIGNYAFYGCNSLTSVTMPFVGAEKDGSTNTHFGYIFGASSYSANSTYVPTSLKEVIITGGTSIGDWAFYNCSSLTSITIPESVTSIGEDAFASCNSLTSITIPASVTSIGENAFANCSSLTSITILASVTSIGEEAFYGTAFYNDDTNWVNGILYIGDYLITVKGISGTCNIREGTKVIADRAFSGRSSLTSITIPASVTSIGERAFAYCSSLQSVTFAGDSKLTSIGESAFYNCSSLNAVYINDLEAWCGIDFGGTTANPLSLAHHLYVGGQEVTDLHIPDGITDIKQYAFCGGAFTSVTIPEGVTSIGAFAFYGCSSLERIEVATKNQNYSSQDGILYNKEKTKIVHVPKAIKGAVTIPASVTSIGGNAFYQCSSLTSITIPEGVTSIGAFAFYGCSSLQSVTFEGDSQLTSIEEDAFSGCSSLTSITIPASVTSIGRWAFYGCSSLTSARFERTDGWKVSENSDMSNAIYVAVSDPQTAAKYLANTYSWNYYWKRY